MNHIPRDLGTVRSLLAAVLDTGPAPSTAAMGASSSSAGQVTVRLVLATCIWERALATQTMGSTISQLATYHSSVFISSRVFMKKGTRARGTPLRRGHRECLHAGGRSSSRSCPRSA